MPGPSNKRRQGNGAALNGGKGNRTGDVGTKALVATPSSGGLSDRGLRTITRKASNEDNISRPTTLPSLPPSVPSKPPTNNTTTKLPAKNYPQTLSKKPSLAFNPNLPKRPDFDQFGSGLGRGKGNSYAGSSVSAGSSTKSDEVGSNTSGSGGSGGKSAKKDGKADLLKPATTIMTTSQAADAISAGAEVCVIPTVTPRKSSKSKAGRGKSKNGTKTSKSTTAERVDGIPQSGASMEKENVVMALGHGPAPTPGRGRPSRKPRKALPNFSSSQPHLSRPTSTSPPPPSNSFHSVEYQSLEELLSQAGYKDTRVFTPEAEKLKKMFKDRSLRKVRSTLDSSSSSFVGSNLIVASEDANPVPAVVPLSTTEANDETSTSPPYQDVETSSGSIPAPSTSASSNSWWTALSLPWTATTSASDDSSAGMTGSSAKHALEAALRSTMAALEDPYVNRKDGLRKMRSENDIASRVTGFDWSDEPLQARVKIPRTDDSPAGNALGRVSPSRHWSDTVVNDHTSTWGDGSPIKRKRRVLNRVALEIEIAKTEVHAVEAEETSDDSQVLLKNEAPTEDLSPTTSTISDATITPLSRGGSPETTESDDILEVEGEIGLTDGELSGIGVPTTPIRQVRHSSEEPAFDALAYEARDSGDFDGFSASSSVHESLSFPTRSPSKSPPHTNDIVATPPRSQSRLQTPITSPTLQRTASPPTVSLDTACLTLETTGAIETRTTSTRQLKHTQSVPAFVHNRLATEPSKGEEKSAGWFPAFGMPWSKHTAVRPTMPRSVVSTSKAEMSKSPSENQPVARPLQSRAVTSLMSTTRRPASPKLVRGTPIVCDSNRAEDLPPFAGPPTAPIEPIISTDAQITRFQTLRNVLSLSALKFARSNPAPMPSTTEESSAPTLSPRLEWSSDDLDWSSSVKPHGFNALYKHKDDSPRFQYTDNIDEVEAYNEGLEQEYQRHEPDFTQSFFYQPPTPPRPVDASEVDTPRKEAKRTQSIKSLRAHLLKQTMASRSNPNEHIPPVPPLPKYFTQPQAIVDRRPPPPVFAISSPGATEAGLPPRELVLEGEEWDAGSFESNRLRQMSGVRGSARKVERKLSRRSSLKKKKSVTGTR